MSTCENTPASSLSMLPYAGAWSFETASHLLRRTAFGPTKDQIDQLVSLGLDQAVESLLQIHSSEAPTTWHPDEAIGSQGDTWISEYLPLDLTLKSETNIARKNSMYSWIVKRLNQEQLNPPSITEKMCFFWHNHFAVARTTDDRINYTYHKLLETHALGNFNTLTEEITINPLMMLFLDTAWSTKWSPNENYAREFLELFTVGIGPQVGPGDYSNYTEEDVAVGAKILTGWKVRENESHTDHPYSEFDPLHHDTTDKTFSYHFNNTTLSNADQLEYKDFVNVIFQKDETALHISRKLYTFFVNTEITLEIDTQVINTMKQTLLANNYEIRPVLVELFKSEHFYDTSNVGSHIKSPFEFLFSMLNPTQTLPNHGFEGNNLMWRELYIRAVGFDLHWYKPPSVAGWPAYYKTPTFMQNWINSGTISNRFYCVTELTTSTDGINSDEFGTLFNLKIDVLNFVSTLQTPHIPTALIDEISQLFFARPLDQTKKDILLNTLTGGLPQFEWTIQYNEYSNPFLYKTIDF